MSKQTEVGVQFGFNEGLTGAFPAMTIEGRFEFKSLFKLYRSWWLKRFADRFTHLQNDIREWSADATVWLMMDNLCQRLESIFASILVLERDAFETRIGSTFLTEKWALKSFRKRFAQAR